MVNNVLKRAVAAFVDYIVNIFLSSFVFILPTVTPIAIIVYIIAYLVLQTIKDLLFKNASLGKRIMNIAIVKTDGTELKPVDIIKRNITLILLPLEMFFLVFNYRRIGDLWAKTDVVDVVSQKE